MQFNSKTLAVTVIGGAALATTALAQMSAVPSPPAAAPPAAHPVEMPNPVGMPKPGVPLPGKMWVPMPFASGTVSATDAGAGTITLTPMFGGAASQTVKVTGNTQVTAQLEAKVGDLKVGDRVRVFGVPTEISATQITAGDSPDSLLGSPFGAIKPVGLPGVAPPQGMATAQAIGKISSLSPLTVAISDSVSVILKPAPEVRVTKMVTEKATDIKVGDRITANGDSQENGALTATRIRVNMDNGSGPPRKPFPLPNRLPTPDGKPWGAGGAAP